MFIDLALVTQPLELLRDLDGALRGRRLSTADQRRRCRVNDSATTQELATHEDLLHLDVSARLLDECDHCVLRGGKDKGAQREEGAVTLERVLRLHVDRHACPILDDHGEIRRGLVGVQISTRLPRTKRYPARAKNGHGLLGVACFVDDVDLRLQHLLEG